METNDGIETVAEANSTIMAELEKGGDGINKYASSRGTTMIRRELKENGFCRRILPPEPIVNEDLDRVLDHDQPVMICDMESKSKGASTIPFGGAADTQFYYGDKYELVFYPITTPEWTKDINELRTYKQDLRQVTTNNSLNSIEVEEDSNFIGLCEEIVGASNGVGATGVQQNFAVNNTITRSSYRRILEPLEKQNLNNGIVLMNRITAKAFLDFDRSEIGGDMAQALFTQGLSALTESKVYGIPHIFTIKRNIIPDGQVWIFSEPNFTGRFGELEKTNLYIEKKKHILRFSAMELIGVTIANVASVAKFTFQT